MTKTRRPISFYRRVFYAFLYTTVFDFYVLVYLIFKQNTEGIIATFVCFCISFALAHSAHSYVKNIQQNENK